MLNIDNNAEIVGDAPPTYTDTISTNPPAINIRTNFLSALTSFVPSQRGNSTSKNIIECVVPPIKIFAISQLFCAINKLFNLDVRTELPLRNLYVGLCLCSMSALIIIEVLTKKLQAIQAR